MAKTGTPDTLQRVDPDLHWTGQDASGRNLMLAEILAQVSREALQGEGLDAVLQRIVDCMVRHLPVAVASIILLDEYGAYFVQEVCAGEFDLEQPSPLPWPISVGASGRCVRTGQAQLITDVEHDPDYMPGNRAVRAEYLVPIRHRDRMHGVLNLESTRSGFFTPQACAIFDAVADQVAGAIHLARLAGELELANRKLEQLSMSDGLTGIANRRCFDQRLADDWHRLAREQRSLALLLVDADNFKPLNDARGHLYGDQCLRSLAHLCSQFAEGRQDLVARYGGEELMLLLPDRKLDAALRIAERLRHCVEAAAMEHPASNIAGHVTVSIGVSAARPAEGRSPQDLIAAADQAMYAAKSRGRNRVVGLPVDADSEAA